MSGLTMVACILERYRSSSSQSQPGRFQGEIHLKWNVKWWHCYRWPCYRLKKLKRAVAHPHMHSLLKNRICRGGAGLFQLLPMCWLPLSLKVQLSSGLVSPMVALTRTPMLTFSGNATQIPASFTTLDNSWSSWQARTFITSVGSITHIHSFIHSFIHSST